VTTIPVPPGIGVPDIWIDAPDDKKRSLQFVERVPFVRTGGYFDRSGVMAPGAMSEPLAGWKRRKGHAEPIREEAYLRDPGCVHAVSRAASGAGVAPTAGTAPAPGAAGQGTGPRPARGRGSRAGTAGRGTGAAEEAREGPPGALQRRLEVFARPSVRGAGA